MITPEETKAFAELAKFAWDSSGNTRSELATRLGLGFREYLRDARTRVSTFRTIVSTAPQSIENDYVPIDISLAGKNRTDNFRGWHR